jgi:hypothetical protein
MHCDPATQAKKHNPGNHSYMVPRGMGPTLARVDEAGTKMSTFAHRSTYQGPVKGTST